MNKVLQSILILSLTIIAAKAVPELSAPFYYVSPTGDNTANGSLEAPFQSITHAIDTINASESKSGTVYITPGTYSLSEIHDNHSLICITNQIALVGTTGDPNDVVIQRVNISSARVAYINHQNALVQGITMKDGLLNNTQHNCGANVYINEQGGTINNCIIDNGNGNAYNGYAGNIYALGGHILNSIVKNGKTGNNWDNGVGGILAKNTIIENCIIYKNSGTKIDTASAVRLVGDSLLLNCTIVGNVVSRNGGYTILVENNSKVINSIFYNNVTEDNFPCENFSGNLNNIYNCAIDREFTSGTANVQMPYGPFFVDSKNQNFNLTLISPALDAGMSHNEIISQFGITPHSTDIVGTPRDNMVDIGAYELNTPVFTTYFDISTSPETVGEHTFDFFVKSRGGSGNISYTWDFGDNTIENSTAETISHKFTTPGVYTVKVIARDAQSNSTEFTRTDFIIIRNPIIYVDQNNANPLWPYDTPETAITSISSAIEQAVDGMTVVILNSLYNISTEEQIIVDKPITISGATGNPADTIIKNTASKTKNLFAIKIANANAVVRNLTYHGTLFAAWDVNTPPFLITQAGGTFSNCVFRSGILQGAYY